MNQGRLAVCIGGSKGIGISILEMYGTRDYNLTTLGRNSPESRLNNIRYIEMDIDSQSSLENAIDRLIEDIMKERYNQVSIFFVSGSSLKINDSEAGNLIHLSKLNQVMTHNVTMPYWVTKKITNEIDDTDISLEFHYLSSAVAINMSMHGIYNASKNTLEHLIVSLLKERRVNTYYFGYRLGMVKVRHKYFAKLENEDKDKFNRIVEEKIPSGYMSTPEDIAKFVFGTTANRDMCNGMIADISGGHSWI
tara:strand:+ start:4668 stop:5417 length:750 start_codon:yes stop_codon:yes gene_type:complete